MRKGHEEKKIIGRRGRNSKIERDKLAGLERTIYRPSRIIMSFVIIVILIINTFSFAGFASADHGSVHGFSGQGNSVSYVNRQTYQPSFQTYYRAENRLASYWPILDEKTTCEARQDILIQVAPAGCQPAVVRSDLLAEQNVPVFCQIDALKVNPVIDINEIRNIRFTGQYPNEIVGVGFHPARAALRTRDILLGSPLINNIGYVVVVLKQNPKEKELPDFVNVTLTAQIQYDAGNAIGTGTGDFLLREMTDKEWENEKNLGKQSFWKGRYFIRADEVDVNFATVSIYQGDRKLTTVKVEKGTTSQDIFVPGSYCRAGFNIQYVGFDKADKKARIEVDDDVFDVYESSRFLNGKCSVGKIEVNEIDRTGNVTISCGSSRFILELGQGGGIFNAFGVDADGNVNWPKPENDKYVYELDGVKYTIDNDNKFKKFT
ncbi:MAG: hypothetical protein HY363_01740, partial [Candidatus Aenigmarchaeota archaeon]|nr:hypothetical protein [Candidatus Aenigmarchaeota archaeon]